MAREAILEIDCSRYSERIMDVVILLYEIGWKYYDAEKILNICRWEMMITLIGKRNLFQRRNYRS